MSLEVLKTAEIIIDRCSHMVSTYSLPPAFRKNPIMGTGVKRSIFGGGGFMPVSFKKDMFRCRKNLLYQIMPLCLHKRIIVQ